MSTSLIAHYQEALRQIAEARPKTMEGEMLAATARDALAQQKPLIPLPQPASRRDEFAGRAMQTFLVGATLSGLESDDMPADVTEALRILSRACYRIADAMMEARA